MLTVGQALDVLHAKAVAPTQPADDAGPARAAGLGALQSFLESGFDTFRAMHGAREFLAQIETRERSLAPPPVRGRCSLRDAAALGQLP